MPEHSSARRANTAAYTKLIELAALRLRFAAATESSREGAVQALDAEADRIVEALQPYGSELQVGNALVVGGANWDQVVADFDAFADDITRAADAVTDAAQHAVDAIHDVVHAAANEVVDAITLVVGGFEMRPQETVEIVGLIEEVAAGRSADELIAAKEHLVEVFADHSEFVFEGEDWHAG